MFEEGGKVCRTLVPKPQEPEGCGICTPLAHRFGTRWCKPCCCPFAGLLGSLLAKCFARMCFRWILQLLCFVRLEEPISNPRDDMGSLASKENHNRRCRCGDAWQWQRAEEESNTDNRNSSLFRLIRQRRRGVSPLFLLLVSEVGSLTTVDTVGKSPRKKIAAYTNTNTATQEP
jgi:hypothetical protein